MIVSNDISIHEGACAKENGEPASGTVIKEKWQLKRSLRHDWWTSLLQPVRKGA